MGNQSKNIHLLPTDKPSRIYLIKSNNRLGITSNNAEFTENFGSGTQNQNIYITSDEEIKEGDWYVNTLDEVVRKNNTINHSYHKKIILTTDQDLDGVQAISDDFLEWFVKNPSCEFIEVKNGVYRLNSDGEEIGFPDMSLYKIILPKEELERGITITHVGKETLEEVAERLYPENWESIMDGQHDSNSYQRNAFIKGAKWQQERSYSEEEVKEQLNLILAMKNSLLDTFTDDEGFITDKWFEQF